MPIKDPNFSSVARPQSMPVYDLDDIHRIAAYKNALVDQFLYATESEPGKKITRTEKEGMLADIKKAEKWTVKETEAFIHKSIIL